jgi:glycosyltransferase involved in cell wall biosynthesis
VRVRVLLVSHRFPPDDVGGVERYTEGLAASLTSNGDRVSILARRSIRGCKEIRMQRERLADGTALYRLVAGSFSFEHFLDNHERLERMFTMAILESSPEVVHINHLMGFSPNFIRIAHRLGAAVVVSLHDFYFSCPKVHLQKPAGDLCNGPDDGRECSKTCFTNGTHDSQAYWGIRARYFRQSLEMAERILCYSGYVHSHFRAELGDKAPIQVIPNGVPHQTIKLGSHSDQRTRGTVNLAYFGTVAPHKGPHVILEALRIAGLSSVNLAIIGHIPEVEYAKQLRKDAATIPGVTLRMYGKYERHELSFLLRDVDCVVVPSLVPEAGPIVPREALAEGVPVVAARLGALPELIREGENGFTFDSQRPDELASILNRIASDDALRTTLRAGARNTSVITVSEHANQVRLAYERAIEEFESNPRRSTDTAEFNLLHRMLIERGCDPSMVARRALSVSCV